jgi:hypothetical protein
MPNVTGPEEPIHVPRRWLTWGNLIWLLIVVMIILTIMAMIWASKQPPIHSEPGPPLS